LRTLQKGRYREPGCLAPEDNDAMGNDRTADFQNRLLSAMRSEFGGHAENDGKA